MLDAHDWQNYWVAASSSISHSSTASSSQLDSYCNRFAAAP